MEYNTLSGIIFDLDGTLLDSMGMWHAIDCAILEHYGLSCPDNLSDIIRHLSIEESSAYFVEHFNLPCTPSQFSDLVAEYARDGYYHKLPLKQGARELIAYLNANAIPFAVVTATYPKLATAALKRLGLWESCRFLITEQEFGDTKANPAIFHEAAHRLSRGKRQLAIVEDSLHVVQNAKKAGYFTIGVYDEAAADSWATMQKTATITVENLADIIEILP